MADPAAARPLHPAQLRERVCRRCAQAKPCYELVTGIDPGRHSAEYVPYCPRCLLADPAILEYVNEVRARNCLAPIPVEP
jgi:hypothetical protein